MGAADPEAPPPAVSRIAPLSRIDCGNVARFAKFPSGGDSLGDGFPVIRSISFMTEKFRTYVPKSIAAAPGGA
jgi:hypothetical protein